MNYIKKDHFLQFLFCCFPFSCFAFDAPTITRFQHEKHSYLCFNDTQFIHDPDCGCNDFILGYFIDDNRNERTVYLWKQPAKKSITEYYLQRVPMPQLTIETYFRFCCLVRV